MSASAQGKSPVSLFLTSTHTYINHQGLLEEDIIVVFEGGTVAGAAPAKGIEIRTLAHARGLFEWKRSVTNRTRQPPRLSCSSALSLLIPTFRTLFGEDIIEYYSEELQSGE